LSFGNRNGCVGKNTKAEEDSLHGIVSLSLTV
jgi:hypothetical protein